MAESMGRTCAEDLGPLMQSTTSNIKFLCVVYFLFFVGTQFINDNWFYFCLNIKSLLMEDYNTFTFCCYK